MTKLKTQADISKEMTVERFGHGVILKNPQAESENKLTLGEVLALPVNVYLLNNESQHCAINDISVETCGWSSTKDALGKSVDHIWPDAMSMPVLNNDRSVVDSNKLKVIEEDVCNEKIIGLQALSFKFPWFNEKGLVVGVFGFSIVPDTYPFYSLGNSLSILANTQLLNTSSTEASIDTNLTAENYFTRRETDVLRLLGRGRTSKEIASMLKLSHRTVEHYLENAKRKVGVSSKSELIDKLINVDF